MIKVSIVIPIYNSAEYLRRCLESVVKQDLSGELDVLLINDGSTDDSLTIATEYVKKYPFVTLYNFENTGVSASRNRGIKYASGDYVMFVDSDDELEEGYISTLISSANKYDADIVYSGFTEIDEEKGTRVKKRDKFVCFSPMSGLAWLKTRMDQGDWYNQVWCGLYRTKYLVDNELFFDEELSLYEDIVFSNIAPLYSDRIAFVESYGYNYYINTNSLSHSVPDRTHDVECCLEVIRRLINYCTSCDNLDYSKSLGRVLMETVSMTLYYIGEGKLNLSLYKDALKDKVLLKLMKGSISNSKELIKYLIFKYAIGVYYRLM